MATTRAKTTTEEDQSIPDVRPATSSELVRPSQEDIDAAHAIQGEVVGKRDDVMQTFVTWLVERADTTDEDQYAVMASIMADIMNAENPADVLKEQSTLKAADVIGVPLLMHGFEIRNGTYEESQFEYYAAITVSRPGADATRILTCGATKVLMKLYMLDKFDEWPQVFWFTSKPGKKGNILDIVRD